jgi:pentatricopeptide repeat protein
VNWPCTCTQRAAVIGDAQRVFDRMEEYDVITWTVMTGGIAQHGYGVKAYELLLLVQKEGYVPDATTCVSILDACASAGSLKWV